ncbi:SDR family oxidoreductase [Nocardia bovistercoris]|uniref:NAD(P)H-binding protein n=1 Tax=Nocardia bovistercoris TaxID=2785916 RepID=A0A931ICK4_9NOCA|nr:NAD(P)H-binding protein [Nocardia bovistercoris]MBH0777318.1 NAD(P)H-binding protein [Nocardia bovistercoris]
MSTILITGGTGALGTHIVDRLDDRGHDVRVLSRREGAGTHVGDLATGVGVDEAALGAELIVHAASDFRAFGRHDPDQTRAVLRAARDARHLLYVSIVGIDRIPFRYYRRKLECEQLVADSGIPHTILRATQFHELIASVLYPARWLPLVPLPLDFRFQTVATGDVATRVADLIEGDPVGRADDFGGPEVRTLAELVEIWRAAHGGPRRAVRLPLPGRIARAFRDGVNTCPEHADGVGTFAEFAARSSGNPYVR